jgi:hypothetical protein
MNSIQLADIAYRLGAINCISTQLFNLTEDLNDLGEGELSVTMELTVKAFDERSAEYRKILDQYPDEIPIDPTRSREG